MTARRAKETIIADILAICRNGASKTRVVYQANMNFKTIDPYLELLIGKKLLQIGEDSPRLYKTSSGGLEILERLKEIETLID